MDEGPGEICAPVAPPRNAAMKAMVLAAGLGTRLRPLTDSRPKALVELGGHTLLEITLRRLLRFGIAEAIVNVHHFAEMLVDYLNTHDFGMRVAISREDELLLDTGGGLLHAADFFLQGAASVSREGELFLRQPFLLHNVDVLTDIDLGEMLDFHRAHDALATLAVQRRKSSRALLFDAQGQLCGRRSAGQQEEIVRAVPQPEAWAFTGVHILSPRIFKLVGTGRMGSGLTGGGPLQSFPIIPEYLRLAGAGEKILGWSADGYYWRDLGTFAALQQAAQDLERKLVEL